MKAKETSLFEFLNGTKQFVIPIYQRTYSWTRDQCEQLWKDIERLANDPKIKGHFIGSFVFVEDDEYNKSVVPQLLVIDGQQRLTTVSLIIAALAKVIDERKHEQVDITSKKLFNYYLRNNDEDGEQHYKLLLTQSDKSALIHVVTDQPFNESDSQRVRENYDYFLRQMRTVTNLQATFNGLQRLIVVEISLEREKDNPQLIFESLNSTGLKLTQADLIRNYILMGQTPERQTSLYNQHWYPMEQRFGSDYAARFDRFMRDYLTIKLGRIPNIDDVYEEFKKYMREKQLHVGDVVKNIDEYSQYYAALSFVRVDDADLAGAIRDLQTIKVEVAYPFLMECLRLYQAHHLTRTDMIRIIRLAQSYVFRRAICGIPTNSLNKTFANLSRDMEDSELLARFGFTIESSFITRLEAALLDKDSYRRFPNDDEFQRELLAKDINNFRNRNYLLYNLQAVQGDDLSVIERLNVSQIIPTAAPLPLVWQTELGTEWETIQVLQRNRLSNLTLVHTSDDENSSFALKRDRAGGFSATGGQLNAELSELERWSETAIQRRASTLAALACTVWQYPDTIQPVVQSSPIQTNETALESEFLQGEMRELYEELRRRILNLDVGIREDAKKLYIAFKTDTNIADIVPQQKRLRISLNMPFSEIVDPRGICKDVTDLGRWGNGDVEFGLKSLNELDYALYLIQQSLAYHSDEE